MYKLFRFGFEALRTHDARACRRHGVAQAQDDGGSCVSIIYDCIQTGVGVGEWCKMLGAGVVVVLVVVVLGAAVTGCSGGAA